MNTRPDPFDERIELARKLADERRYPDAIVMFNWLCQAYPERAAAVVDSAITLSRVYDYAGVQQRFAHVQSREGVPAAVWIAMADISRQLRRPQWSREFFSNAINVKNPSADACGLFALFQEQSGELDQADELCQRGLKLDCQNSWCQLARAKVLRRRRAFEAAIGAVGIILRNPNAEGRSRISALYELAHLQDLMGDYGAAMAALVSAKSLVAAEPKFAAFQQRAMAAEKNHHRFLTTVTPDYFESAVDWQPESPHRMALLGGHPRSGTTLLEQVLDSHTQIISAEETLVFANGVNDPFQRELAGPDVAQAALQITQSRLETFRQTYFQTIEEVIDQPIAGRLLLDKNPSFTDHIPVFARVFPEASYIIALRDPRDVVLSCFFQDLPLNDVTTQFQTLRQTAMRYANTMAMWLVCRENMDEKKWIEVRYESLVNDLPDQASRVMAKLNLDFQPAQSHPEKHAKTRSIISPTYADVTQPVHLRSIGRWKRYEPWLIEAMPTLETFIEAFQY